MRTHQNPPPPTMRSQAIYPLQPTVNTHSSKKEWLKSLTTPATLGVERVLRTCNHPFAKLRPMHRPHPIHHIHHFFQLSNCRLFRPRSSRPSPRAPQSAAPPCAPIFTAPLFITGSARTPHSKRQPKMPRPSTLRR